MVHIQAITEPLPTTSFGQRHQTSCLSILCIFCVLKHQQKIFIDVSDIRSRCLFGELSLFKVELWWQPINLAKLVSKTKIQCSEPSKLSQSLIYAVFFFVKPQCTFPKSHKAKGQRYEANVSYDEGILRNEKSSCPKRIRGDIGSFPQCTITFCCRGAANRLS